MPLSRGFVLAATLALAARASAQFSLLDDFNDGNFNGWTVVDPTGGAGSVSAATNALRASSLVPLPPGAGFGAIYNASTVDPSFSNGVYRATIRINQDFNTGGIAARLDNNLNFYYAFVNHDATGGGLVLNRVVNGVGQFIGGVNLPALDVGETWNLEFSVLGGQLKASAWPVGDAYPGSLLVVHDLAYTIGATGLVAARIDTNPTAGLVDIVADDFQYNVPAPATAPLLLAGLMVLRRRR